MSFDRPVMLLALLAIPFAVGLWLLAERRRMRYAVAFTNLEVLAGIAGGRPWRRYVPPLLFLLALASLCVALARPNRDTMVVNDRATVILVVDVSGSMQAKDVKPTRLAAAQAAVDTFLERVPDRIRVGLIAFAGEPQVAAPPTTDRGVVRVAVDELDFFPGYGGTAIGDALGAAVDLARLGPGDASAIAVTTPGRGKSATAILFLSDGKQTRGILQPFEGAEKAKRAGIPVYTIALGTPQGVITRTWGGTFGGGEPRTIPVPPDPFTLRGIANTTGGRFFAARTADALQSAYEDLGSKLGRVPGRTEVTWWFLAAAAAALVAAGVLSALWAPRLP